MKARILIVEDEALVSWSLKILLVREGYTVLGPVSSGADAIASLEEQPDVILMDIQLTGPMDGVDAAKTIAALSTAKIIFTTGYTDGFMTERARSVQPYAILHKPIATKDLLAELTACLTDR